MHCCRPVRKTSGCYIHLTFVIINMTLQSKIRKSLTFSAVVQKQGLKKACASSLIIDEFCYQSEISIYPNWQPGCQANLISFLLQMVPLPFCSPKGLYSRLKQAGFGLGQEISKITLRILEVLHGYIVPVILDNTSKYFTDYRKKYVSLAEGRVLP